MIFKTIFETKLRPVFYWIVSIIKQPYVVVLVCLAILTIFVLDHFQVSAFWLDEAAVANVVRHQLKDLAYYASIDYHAMLYVFLLKFWAMVFGYSETAFRSFSFLWAGVLVWLCYWVSMKIFVSRKVAYLASFLACTNFFFIWFAAETRPYTLAAVLGFLSFYFFWQSFVQGQKRNYIFYTIFCVLACYTHPWLNLVFAGQFLTLIVFRKRATKFLTLFLTQILIGVLAIPNALIMLYIGAKLGATDWMGPIYLSAIATSVKFLSYGVFWLYFSFAVVALIFWTISSENEAKVKDKNSNPLFFTLWMYFLFPLFGAWAISQWKPFYITGRYEMAVLPAFVLLLAYLFSKIKDKFFLIMFLILAIGFAGKNVIEDRNKVLAYLSTDKSVVESILQRVNDGDVIIAAYLSYPTVDYYLYRLNQTYHKKYQLVVYPQETIEHPALQYDGFIQNNLSLFEQQAKDLVTNLKKDFVSGSGRRIWVVEYSTSQVDGILTKQLEQNFKQVWVEVPVSPRETSWFDEVVVYE